MNPFKIISFKIICQASSAASFLIREWVEKLLGVKFDNLPDLASHLLDKMYVDNRSVAAFTLLSRSGKLDTKTGVVGGAGATLPSNGNDSKLQLQRKLQEVNMKQQQTDTQKRKLSEQTELLIGKRSKVGDTGLEMEYEVATAAGLEFDPGASGSVVTTAPDMKESVQNRYSVVVQNNQNQALDPVYINGTAGICFDAPGSGVASSGEFQVSYTGDRIETAAGRQVTVTSSISLDKLPRKKQVVLVGGADLTTTNGNNQHSILTIHNSSLRSPSQQCDQGRREASSQVQRGVRSVEQ